MNLSTRIHLSVVGLGTKTVGLDTVSDPLIQALSHIWDSGSGALQANKSYHLPGTISASGTTTITLCGDGLVPNTIYDAFHDVVEFSILKAILIVNTHATQAFTVGGNALITSSGRLAVRPGGHFLLTAPDATGLSISTGVSDTISLINGAGSSTTYRVALIGVQAGT